MKRYFTVLCQYDPSKIMVMDRILGPLETANVPDTELVLVCRNKFGFRPPEGSRVRVVEVDDDTASNDAKLKNHVIRMFHGEDGSNGSWLYMMDDSVEVLNASGFETFFTDLERMLDVFGMHAWLNTRTDGMNHVFERYNARFTVVADNERMQKVLGTSNPIYWTSHANTAFMAVSLAETNIERFMFDEKFTIPMYYIVDWICRQKEENERLEAIDPSVLRWHWMNLYPTVESEGGLFKITDWKKSGFDETTWQERGFRSDPTPNDFQEQQKLFDEKKHDYAFAANPDPAFKMMYHRFKQFAERNVENA